MGIQKFKLSDMIPNAWLYKLKHMNKSTSKSTPSKLDQYTLPPPPRIDLQSHPRKSYHITRELTTELPKGILLLHSPPRKSRSFSTKRRSSSTSSCSCRSSSSSHSLRSKSRSPPSPSSLKETAVLINKSGGFFADDALLGKLHAKQSIIDSARLPKTKAEDFHTVINVDEESVRSNKNIGNFKFQLRPIITKQETAKPKSSIKEQSQQNPPSRRFSVSSPGGIRLNINSRRIMGKKQGQNGNNNTDGGRKSTSSKKKKRRSIAAESFAVVKTSRDPQRDFRESMVEMIVQNNLRGSKDLEELLACYLSLNSDEYHDVIIMVFKQLWFDFRHRK